MLYRWDPQIAAEALAAWAVVSVERQCVVSAGPLAGIIQNVVRAEITAVLSSIHWGAHVRGVLHIWCDNQYVVDTVRGYQQHTINLYDLEHADLWADLFDQLAQATATVRIHKVVSHVSPDECGSPLEDWCRVWNHRADLQAGLANLQRPAWFVKVHDAFCAHRKSWMHWAALMRAFHLEVARQDCSDKGEDPEVEEVYTLSSVARFPNDAALVPAFQFVLDHLPFDDAAHVSAAYPVLYRQLAEWLWQQDSGALEKRLVSYIEIYVAFRLSRDEDYPLLVSSGVSAPMVQVTFGADFRFFKQLLKSILEVAGAVQFEGYVHLASAHIFTPQPGFCMFLSGLEHTD